MNCCCSSKMHNLNIADLNIQLYSKRSCFWNVQFEICRCKQCLFQITIFWKWETLKIADLNILFFSNCRFLKNVQFGNCRSKHTLLFQIDVFVNMYNLKLGDLAMALPRKRQIWKSPPSKLWRRFSNQRKSNENQSNPNGN